MKTRTPLITLTLLASLFAGCSKQSPDTIATKNESSATQPTPELAQQVKQIAESFSQYKTSPLSLGEFSQAIEQRAGTNLDNLTASDRQKLIACINRFYACYSSGDYDDFKQFRLLPPFTVDEALASAVKTIATQKGMSLKSDEDVTRFAWNHYNGTNKIGQVNGDHIALSIARRQDLGSDLRQPSVGEMRGPGWSSGVSCWNGAVVYQPTPAELLSKDGSLRFFRLEIIVRFSPLVSGPAMPLVLVGYWDSTRNDWMPYVLCTGFHVGSYETTF
jgi:hypothetical protein